MSRWPISARRAPAALLLALLGVLSVGSTARAAASNPVVAEPAAARGPVAVTDPPPVVLIGTGGVRWDEIGGDDTPALFGLLQNAAAAAMTVRSVRAATCPVDGWLAVSAGQRAADAPQAPAPAPGQAQAGPGRCRTPAAHFAAAGAGAGEAATADGWPGYLAQARSDSFNAAPGLFGGTLDAAGVTTAAVGAGAVIALADRSGQVAHAWPGLPATSSGSVDVTQDGDGLTAQVSAALAGHPRLLVVDVGSVRDEPDDPNQSGDPAQQLTTVDSRIGSILGVLPAGSTVIVASLSDGGLLPHLQFVAGTNSTVTDSTTGDRGFLRSASTRQDGLVQSTDLPPTLLAALGVPTPHGMASAPLRTVAASDDLTIRLEQLIDYDWIGQVIEPLVAPFVVITEGLQLVVFGALAFGAHRLRDVRGGRRLRRRLLVSLRGLAVIFALVPAGTFLANIWPWWRSSHPGVELTIAVITATLPLAAVALLGPWRRGLLGPAAAAGVLTAAVLTADLATGSTLSVTTLFGGQVLVAGRFYGLSNPGFALFATGALFSAMAVADRLAPRRAAFCWVAGIGAVATLIDGLPSLGSDFGGPPALLPAFALLTLWVAGAKVTWRRVAVIGAGSFVALTALCVLDWLRPPDRRTHLGNFVQSVLDGEAGAIVHRKAAQNLDALLATPLTMLLPLAMAAVVLLVARPARWHVTGLQSAYHRSPVLRQGVTALGVLLFIAFLINDSGASIPPVAATLAMPALVAICARSIELDDEEREAELGAQALNQARRSS